MLPQIYRIRPDSARGKKGGIRAHHSTHARDHAVRAQIWRKMNSNMNTRDRNMVNLSSFPFPPTKPNMLIKPKVLRSFCPQVLQLRQDHNGDGVNQIIIENVSNRQLKTNLLNTLASPGLQAIEPIATAEVVNGQMSWAKLYKTSS